MRFFICFIALLLQATVGIVDVNRKECIKGFERLVILSNAQEVSATEMDEAALIADTLLRNKCYEYLVDRRGTVYAGATLSYLFGKICATKNDTTAIRLYIAYMTKTNDSADGELYTSFESLVHRNPVMFLSYISNLPDNSQLLHAMALGFIDNMYETAFVRFNKENYDAGFYTRYPAFKNNVELQSVIQHLFSEIERSLE